MPSKIKEQTVAQIEERFKECGNVVISEYQGLNVEEITELRKLLRHSKAEYKVLKNSLTKIALSNLGHKDLAQFFDGPIGIVFEKGDPAVACKTLVAFSKEHEKFKIKSGMLDGQVIDVNQINRIAKLPSRQVLLAKLASAVAGPMQNFARVLNAPLQGLVNSLNQASKKQA